MAIPHSNHHHNLAALLLVFLFLTSSSYGRLLNDFGLAATEPSLNLALPSDRVVPQEEEPARHVSPCDHMMVAGKMPWPGMRMAGGKYGPMILNMLPKGMNVPPSGPSKGSNDFNN